MHQIYFGTCICFVLFLCISQQMRIELKVGKGLPIVPFPHTSSASVDITSDCNASDSDPTSNLYSIDMKKWLEGKNAFRRYCRAKISFFLWLRAVYQLSCSRVTVCIFVFWSEKHKVCVVNFELWFFVALTRFTRRSHNSLFRCTSSIGVHLAWQ